MLDLQIKDGIAWLTLQRPAALNAINQEMAESLLTYIKELEQRSDVGAVITRGEGRALLQRDC